MKTLSKPIHIQVGASCVKITEVFIQLGHIRCEGWTSCPSKREGFAADSTVAARLGIKSIGGVCLASEDDRDITFPFSFDMQPDFVRPSYRREEMTEALARVTKMLRSAKLHFAKLNRVSMS